MKKILLLLFLAAPLAFAQNRAYVPSSSPAALDAAFAYYDHAFDAARKNRLDYRPWIPRDRDTIRQVVRHALRVREEWIPSLRTRVSGETRNEEYTVLHLRSASWDQGYGAAHLYLPKGRSGKAPAVRIACCHGAVGKLFPIYQRMAQYMASSGLAVLVPDNIGQGERESMGHRTVPGVFDCGLTVQGLIVMETIAWLDWLKAQEQIDLDRIAVCGNSGGGTLGLFLSAVAPDKFSLLVSSGYPSSFEYIARKEKKHCHCNLIPGIVGQVEMWQVLGSFAPKPMYILQGRSDEYFPVDIFRRTARQVGRAYQEQDAADQFKADIYSGTHGWDDERVQNITAYICAQFGLGPFPWDSFAASSLRPASPCYHAWPQDALTITQLAECLSGKTARAEKLSDVFSPHALPLGRDGQPSQLPGGDPREIFAQFESFLSKEW